MELRSSTESEATVFGSAFHKALEHWYCLPESARQLSKTDNELADTLVNATNDVHYEGALETINQFALKAAPIKWLGDGDKRSISNGIKILKAYFKHYANDGLEVMKDAAGLPLVEKNIEFEIYRDAEKIIIYHGQIDMIVRNLISGQVMVADHKTTATLGSQFYNRINPNHQYTGYVWAAREALGIDTNLFLVNGIQVAKTKSEFARQTTERGQEDFNELRSTVVAAVEALLKAVDTNNFPMYAPNPCSNYGSCQYLDICSSPAKLRGTIMSSKYTQQGAENV